MFFLIRKSQYICNNKITILSGLRFWSNPEYSRAEIKRLEEQENRLSKEIYSNLTNWQRVQIARHPDRPFTLD